MTILALVIIIGILLLCYAGQDKDMRYKDGILYDISWLVISTYLLSTLVTFYNTFIVLSAIVFIVATFTFISVKTTIFAKTLSVLHAFLALIVIFTTI